MIAYLDSSVLLRLVLGQGGALREWRSIQQAVASSLVEVECLRTLDRLRLRVGVPDREIAIRREAVFRLLEAVELVEPTARSSPVPRSPCRPRSGRWTRSTSPPRPSGAKEPVAIS